MLTDAILCSSIAVFGLAFVTLVVVGVADTFAIVGKNAFNVAIADKLAGSTTSP